MPSTQARTKLASACKSRLLSSPTLWVTHQRDASCSSHRPAASQFPWNSPAQTVSEKSRYCINRREENGHTAPHTSTQSVALLSTLPNTAVWQCARLSACYRSRADGRAGTRAAMLCCVWSNLATATLDVRGFETPPQETSRSPGPLLRNHPAGATVPDTSEELDQMQGCLAACTRAGGPFAL